MKLVQINTARELKLPGTSVEFVTEGSALKEVILRPEGEEESYSIKPADTYSGNIRVFIRREYEVVDKWRLTGTLCGFPISKDFDSEPEAKKGLDKVHASVEGAKIAPVKVRVDEAGEPVKSQPHLDDIPF